MSQGETWPVLFSEQEIAARVQAMAVEIAGAKVRPQVAMPILVGAFVFAADLVRALCREGLPVEVEMLWLRSYGTRRTAQAISMIAGPPDDIAGKDVLVIDGVLDAGRTIKKAVQLCLAAGAASVQVAVLLDKQRPDRVANADFTGFTVGNEFVIGYGMDDAGKHRGLPYIGRAG
jgi:hypoxanthine phosphoribosyltransferase